MHRLTFRSAGGFFAPLRFGMRSAVRRIAMTPAALVQHSAD